jgi:hypothetical protein
MNSGSHGTDRASDHRRHAFVRHLLDEAQDQDLALLGCQDAEGEMDRLGIFDREVSAAVKFIDRLDFFHSPGPSDSLSEMSDGPVAGHPIQPGRDGTRVGQGGYGSMHIQPDFLQHVLQVRSAFLAKECLHVVPQSGRKPFDQFSERRVLSGLAPEDQDSLIDLIGEVIHAGRPGFECLPTPSRSRPEAEKFNPCQERNREGVARATGAGSKIHSCRANRFSDASIKRLIGLPMGIGIVE